uniref:Uncharacterized protein n=1 Tax=Ditylenchus dipsaci TaxID=166011 RepID=A0A915EES5_9BILA
MKLFLSTLTLAILIFATLSQCWEGEPEEASWWDGLVSSVKDKVETAGKFIHEEAIPAINTGYNKAKEVVEESEVPNQVHGFFKEKAVPAAEQKWEDFKELLKPATKPDN